VNRFIHELVALQLLYVKYFILDVFIVIILAGFINKNTVEG